MSRAATTTLLGRSRHLGYSVEADIAPSTFQENVEEFLKKEQHPSAEHALRDLGEMLSKYNFMDTSLQQRKAKVTSQIPEFKNALGLLKMLKAKKVNSFFFI